MTINVSLETISLPELFSSIDLEMRSGRLIFEPQLTSTKTEGAYQKVSYHLWFDRGKFVAICEIRKEFALEQEDIFERDRNYLETIALIKSRGWIGKLISENLDRLCPKGEPLGVYLSKMKLLNSEQLDSIFQIQLERVYKLFEITSGRLIFTETSELIAKDGQIEMPWLEMTGRSLRAAQLVLNGLRLLDKGEIYENKLPDRKLSLKSTMAEGLTDLELLPLESQLWTIANGKKSLEDMAFSLDRPLEQVCRVASHLLIAGLVKEVPLKSQADSLSNLTATIDLKKSISNDLERLPSLEDIEPKKWKKWCKNAIFAIGVTGITIVGSLVGIFQKAELEALDRAFRWRPLEPIDPRIAIVTIDDSDINNLGEWPISDAKLAQLLTTLQKYNPKAIGLDIYRDIPVEPGHEELLQVYQNSPNLIGIEKVVGKNTVAPPPLLKQLDQVAITDTALDFDGKLRRVLISVSSEQGESYSLGVYLALIYLEAANIHLKPVGNNGEYQLGKALFAPLRANAGGYAGNFGGGTNVGGYQIMLNYRSTPENFHTVSITDVLADRVPSEIIRDRLVLIGTNADSLKDFFATPYSFNRADLAANSPGVLIHANVASQILSAALDGRPLIKFWRESQEWLWILGWSAIGTILARIFLERQYKKRLPIALSLCLVAGGSVIGIGYLIFLAGWWVPVISPSIATVASMILLLASERKRKYQQQIYLDLSTRLVNRRYFQSYLEQQWQVARETSRHLALIVVTVERLDSVSQTKRDKQASRSAVGSATQSQLDPDVNPKTNAKFLRQIVKAIESVIDDRGTIARYEKDTFAIVLPKINAQIAMQIARTIVARVNAIPRTRLVKSEETTPSPASVPLILSCKVASIIPTDESSSAELLAMTNESIFTSIS
jgi:CHASE2 domain-containing sensor protein/GGDEF domain-containing protein